MAGYRAFARAVSLRTDGAYVPDVLGFETSRMFIEPERHTVTVYEASEATDGLPPGNRLCVRPCETDGPIRSWCGSHMTHWLSGWPLSPRTLGGGPSACPKPRSSLMKLVHAKCRPRGADSVRASGRLFGRGEQRSGVREDRLERSSAFATRVDSLVEGVHGRRQRDHRNDTVQ